MLICLVNIRTPNYKPLICLSFFKKIIISALKRKEVDLISLCSFV